MQPQRVKKDPWGSYKSEEVFLFTLQNSHGMTVRLSSYGGIIVECYVPDKSGQFRDVVLGFSSLEDYLKFNGPYYFGCITGRVCNRITNGTFELEGQNYKLIKNNGENCLHGGIEGFNSVAWRGEIIEGEAESGVAFTYISEDGEEGFPGTLSCKVSYFLNEHNEIRIEYEATTDKATIVNLTNHSYFNLSGCTKNILDHKISINADHYLPLDKSLMPTGVVAPVQDTPMDLRKPVPVGQNLKDSPDFDQFVIAGGFDASWVLNQSQSEYKHAATVQDETSGIILEATTTCPTLQFYTGNFLDGAKGKNGIAYDKNFGLCLETQLYTDAINQPTFPTIRLNPGQVWDQKTKFKFSVQ